jgi:purine-binding chemotaxis protein CheW
MNENSKNKSRLAKQIAFDWDSIRQRIAAASAAMSETDETAPEVVEQVWARRAERLAQMPVKPEEGEQIQLALLRLGREVYGLDVEYVLDIRPVEPRSVTPVPRVPAWVAGVVNLRGRIFSVVDLQRFLGLAPTENADGGAPTRFLTVVETPEMELALIVDEVLPQPENPAADSPRIGCFWIHFLRCKSRVISLPEECLTLPLTKPCLSLLRRFDVLPIVKRLSLPANLAS